MHQNSQPELVDSIDRRLPQTQCTKCDYPNCREYARAIAAGEAAINQCPPGGAVTINALARLLDCPPLPLNPANGVHRPLQIAVIREADCIGCKLCINACPVDCIIGAAKLMHTVIATDCSGCELCLPVCPTDCIDMVAPAQAAADAPASWWRALTQPQVNNFRRRAEAKRQREEVATRDAKQSRTETSGALREEVLAALKRKKVL